jgi:hypothetical protein
MRRRTGVAMSLIGSLEDLSLGDILQIISLSKKSGVLALRTNDGEGRVVFRSGLVCGAVAKDGPRDLRGVLVGGGFVEEADFAAAEIVAREQERELDEVLGEAGPITAERLASLRREAVEAAVVGMFRWREGDFSFDVRETCEAEDPELILPVGINAQYLAMEGARCDDEGERDDVALGATDDMSAHEIFDVEPVSAPAPAPLEAVSPVAAAVDWIAETTAQQHAPLEELEPLRAEPETLPPPKPDADVELQRSATPVTAGPPAALDRQRPIIAIDGDLPALEWTKAALAGQCERVHIFQRADLGLTRIRQYLARAVAPIVLLSPATPGDRLSGIADAEDFVRRLKQQAPMIRVVWLQEDGVVGVAEPAPADAIATRPAGHQLRSVAGGDASGRLAEALRELVASVGSDRRVSDSGARVRGDAFEDLKRATSRLRDASRRGEVLGVVIDFASQHFRRVALLMVRDGVAIGVAQHGLSVCGGPDDHGLRDFELPVEDSHWLTRVVAERAPIRAAPDGPGDVRLAAALGDRQPSEAYLAPIESCGKVVAVIYGDDLPGAGQPVDTSALEAVLHHAGLALDRAVLERTATSSSE